MSSTIAGVISKIRAARDAWVTIASVAQAAGGVLVTLLLRRGKGGPILATWSIRCRRVHELEISDLNGGGICLYSSGHPAARQYASPVQRLSCRTHGDGSRAWLAVVSAHVAAVDDWIPADRYLPATPPSDGTLLIRAPEFLARVYARALRRLGIGVRSSIPRHVTRRRRSPKVLHLGDSFIVAETFEVQGPANSQVERVK